MELLKYMSIIIVTLILIILILFLVAVVVDFIDIIAIRHATRQYAKKALPNKNKK